MVTVVKGLESHGLIGRAVVMQAKQINGTSCAAHVLQRGSSKRQVPTHIEKLPFRDFSSLRDMYIITTPHDGVVNFTMYNTGTETFENKHGTSTSRNSYSIIVPVFVCIINTNTILYIESR